MPTPDWKDIARQLNEHLSRTRLSSQDLASRAGVDRKTVERLRAGRAVRPQTLQWIEQALKIPLGSESKDRDAAPARYGGYRLDAVAAFMGEYTGYRRSFDTPGHIIASYLKLAWDEAEGALRFTENQLNKAETGTAYEYHFGGDVLIPPNLGVLHLVVHSGDGRVRLISTAMPREDQGTLYMKGFILTLNEIRDIGYYPVTSPIFFAKHTGNGDPRTGVIRDGDDQYGWADAMLTDIERKFLPFRA